MMRVYVAGAWVEQHQRARPMIAALRGSGLVEITCDWTQAEGDVCSCGCHRQQHAPLSDPGAWRLVESTRCETMLPTGHVGDVERCACNAFNGIGAGGDSQLTAENRRKYAIADLKGVIAADLVWLLAANDRGASGSWVELGAALSLRDITVKTLSGPRPKVVVSGPKWQRTIFTELADKTIERDDIALEYVLHEARKIPPMSVPASV